jgi:transposase-like protein
MPRSGPRAVRRFSDEFKLAALRLSQEPAIQVQTVAAALALHPFMRSNSQTDAWRQSSVLICPLTPE